MASSSPERCQDNLGVGWWVQFALQVLQSSCQLTPGRALWGFFLWSSALCRGNALSPSSVMVMDCGFGGRGLHASDASPASPLGYVRTGSRETQVGGKREDEDGGMAAGACLTPLSAPSNLGWHLLLLARSWQRGRACPSCSHPCDPPLWHVSRRVISS